MKYIHQIMVLFTLLVTGSMVKSQVNWATQYMGRGEYRHGFQTPASTNAKPGVFIGQRARIGMKYNAEKFRVGINVQDIRTWGQTANGSQDVAGLLSLHEGYAEIMPSSKISIKAGRQEIAYDEDRIFGSLDWALFARRHDAAIFKYEDSTLKAHAGAAYNQDKEQSNNTVYTVPNNYKTFQFVYVSKQIKDLTLSLLALNNGLQWTKKDSLGAIVQSGVRFTQTAGLRCLYSKNKLGANATFYYQGGTDVANKSVQAFQGSAEASYKVIEKLKLIGGYEYLSGTSQTNAANTSNNSFMPFYGTNHRFNGYMDLFYVGNHANSVGLQDPYFKAVLSTKRFITSLNAHGFMAAAPIRDMTDPTVMKAMPGYLGTEVDFTFLFSIAEFVSLQAGYSHFMPTASFQQIRGGDRNEIQNWAYLMLLVRPGVAKFPRTGLKM